MDCRTMATEIGFGIRDTGRGNGFVSQISLDPVYGDADKIGDADIFLD